MCIVSWDKTDKMVHGTRTEGRHLDLAAVRHFKYTCLSIIWP